MNSPDVLRASGLADFSVARNILPQIASAPERVSAIIEIATQEVLADLRPGWSSGQLEQLATAQEDHDRPYILSRLALFEAARGYPLNALRGLSSYPSPKFGIELAEILTTNGSLKDVATAIRSVLNLVKPDYQLMDEQRPVATLARNLGIDIKPDLDNLAEGARTPGGDPRARLNFAEMYAEAGHPQEGLHILSSVTKRRGWPKAVAGSVIAAGYARLGIATQELVERVLRQARAYENRTDIPAPGRNTIEAYPRLAVAVGLLGRNPHRYLNRAAEIAQNLAKPASPSAQPNIVDAVDGLIRLAEAQIELGFNPSDSTSALLAMADREQPHIVMGYPTDYASIVREDAVLLLIKAGQYNAAREALCRMHTGPHQQDFPSLTLLYSKLARAQIQTANSS